MTMRLQAARAIFVNIVAAGLIGAAVLSYGVGRFEWEASLIAAGSAALATIPAAWVLVRLVSARQPLPPAWAFAALWIAGACAVIFGSHLLLFGVLDQRLHPGPALRFVWTTVGISHGGVLVAAALLGVASRGLLRREEPAVRR